VAERGVAGCQESGVAISSHLLRHGGMHACVTRLGCQAATVQQSSSNMLAYALAAMQCLPSMQVLAKHLHPGCLSAVAMEQV
jgi:hypothetical protein